MTKTKDISFIKLMELAKEHSEKMDDDAAYRKEHFKHYRMLIAKKEAEFKEEAKRMRNTGSPEFLNRYYDL